ncbi:pyridoxamine 5'-phosphate oxidase family protein [Sphingomonas mesophila]|uniref:pyridoxamine 5'-phosphate oxidase family protein n=1 Tax=Sphingomonas mesophila TaxID=2303576 RepID=UPI000E57F7DE|nr:pyridoxamine 5'-phosphate oxidase family protein [Sphingomonas mesophila]
MAGMTLAEISEKMRDLDFTILSTRTESGALAGRPMSNNREVDYDGDSFFFTCEDTKKVGDIRRDPNVALGYQGGAGEGPPLFITVEGEAELIQDKAAFEKHWVKDLERWFKQGVDTPGLTLIRVRARKVHYWDGGDEGEIVLDGAEAQAAHA